MKNKGYLAAALKYPKTLLDCEVEELIYEVDSGRFDGEGYAGLIETLRDVADSLEAQHEEEIRRYAADWEADIPSAAERSPSIIG